MITLFELEDKYKDILENIEEWAYIRLKVGFYLRNKENKENKNLKNNKINNISNKLLKIKDIFYGFKNWFGNYEYLFFSYSEQRKLINNKWKNKSMDDLIDKINKKALLMETNNTKRFKNVYTKYIVGEEIIYFLGKIFLLFCVKGFFWNNDYEKIRNILKNNNIKINLEKEIKSFFIFKFIYKSIIKFYKPKKVFVTCYYCRLPLVKACHEMNIPIVDIQHGVISKEHFGYISNIKIDKCYIANEILSFGENEKQIKNFMIKKTYPIGSYYLEYLKNHFKPSKEILTLKKKYEYCIGISMQDQAWEHNNMMKFANELSKIHKNILFLIIPRKNNHFSFKESNIRIVTFLDCYNTIMHCDVHMTLYSSCALEAPTLGIPNILVNVNNMATKYYIDMLSNYHTKIIDKTDSFYNVFKELILLDSQKIKEKNKKIFVPDYNKQVLDYVRNYL